MLIDRNVTGSMILVHLLVKGHYKSMSAAIKPIKIYDTENLTNMHHEGQYS